MDGKHRSERDIQNARGKQRITFISVEHLNVFWFFGFLFVCLFVCLFLFFFFDKHTHIYVNYELNMCEICDSRNLMML